MRRFILDVALAGLFAVTLGAVVAASGIIPIAASSGHWPTTVWFLEFGKSRSVATSSMGIEVPPLDDARLVMMGAGHYETGCRFCHGAPGVTMPVVAAAMTPHPPRLSGEVGQYDDAELFYIVRHGILFTGMPAWPAQERPDEVWAVVAFLRRLPDLSPTAYRALVFGAIEEDRSAPEVVLDRCARCHGVDGLGRGEGAFPVLAAQDGAYLARSLAAYAAGERASGIMQPIAADMTEAERVTAAVWYASRPPPGPHGPGYTPGAPPTGRNIERGRAIALGLSDEGGRREPDPVCSSCHGLTQPRGMYPRLAGQYPSYLARQLELFVRGSPGRDRVRAADGRGLALARARRDRGRLGVLRSPRRACSGRPRARVRESPR